MLEYRPRHWRVVFPLVVLQHHPLFEQARKLHQVAPQEAERIYRHIMAACGELHLDAVSHLGMVLNARAPGTGLAYILQAFLQARLLFPRLFEEGRDFLLYESPGNAFILNAYYAMGSELQKARKWADALGLFEFLMLINPPDEYGAGKWIPRLKELVAAGGGTADKSTAPILRP